MSLILISVMCGKYLSVTLHQEIQIKKRTNLSLIKQVPALRRRKWNSYICFSIL